MVDTSVGSVKKVLLLLVTVTTMLGISMEGCGTPVQGVINYSPRNTILIDTSRVSTWERNRTPALTVIRSFHGKLTSTYTTAVFTRVRNHTNAVSVISSFHGNLI